MARLPFSLFKQGTNEYEVKDTTARKQINANNIGTAVNLAGMVHPDGLPSGGYVIPSDGYLYLHNTQYSADYKVKATISGANGTVIGYMCTMSPNDSQLMYVKKGMKVTDYSAINGSAIAQTSLIFYPII